MMKKIPNSGYDDIKIHLLYHSNKIEGSTLSEKGLSQLIMNGEIDLSQEDGVLTADDMNESLNSGKAFDMVIDTLGEPLDKDMLCKWHGMLMKNTSWDKMGVAGCYKKYPNTIRGAAIEVSTIDDVEPLMDDFLQKQGAFDEVNLECIAEQHAAFEHIHPFQDGNGRIGRYIILKQCIENDLELVGIDDSFKYKYYQALETAQVSKYYKPLCDTFEDCQGMLDQSLAKVLPIIEQYNKIVEKETEQPEKEPFPGQNTSVEEDLKKEHQHKK